MGVDVEAHRRLRVTHALREHARRHPRGVPQGPRLEFRFVAFGIRTTVGVLALAALLVLGACGGNGDGGGMSLTMTSFSCTYEGSKTLPAGAISVDVRNETEVAGGFEVVAIAEGSTFDDFVAHVEEERQRIQQGDVLVGQPSFASIAGRVEVAAQESSVLSADVTAGVYALYCFIGPPPAALFVAAPLEVTG